MYTKEFNYQGIPFKVITGKDVVTIVAKNKFRDGIRNTIMGEHDKVTTRGVEFYYFPDNQVSSDCEKISPPLRSYLLSLNVSGIYKVSPNDIKGDFKGIISQIAEEANTINDVSEKILLEARANYTGRKKEEEALLSLMNEEIKSLASRDKN